MAKVSDPALQQGNRLHDQVSSHHFQRRSIGSLKAADLFHVALGTKQGSRKINQAFHVQSENAPHSRLKAFLCLFKGAPQSMWMAM